MQGTRRRDRREKEGGRGADARQGEEGRRSWLSHQLGGGQDRTGLVRRLTGEANGEKEMNRGKKA